VDGALANLVILEISLEGVQYGSAHQEESAMVLGGAEADCR